MIDLKGAKWSCLKAASLILEDGNDGQRWQLGSNVNGVFGVVRQTNDCPSTQIIVKSGDAKVKRVLYGECGNTPYCRVQVITRRL